VMRRGADISAPPPLWLRHLRFTRKFRSSGPRAVT
jgi:hypothetical protein